MKGRGELIWKLANKFIDLDRKKIAIICVGADLGKIMIRKYKGKPKWAIQSHTN